MEKGKLIPAEFLPPTEEEVYKIWEETPGFHPRACYVDPSEAECTGIIYPEYPAIVPPADVEYTKSDDGSNAHLLIMRPPFEDGVDALRPCVVIVPDSPTSDADAFASALAARDLVVAVVKFPDSDKPVFFKQVMDVRNAVRYMRANADSYSADAENIFILGEFSGAPSAMYAAMVRDDAKNDLFPDVSAEVSGIINCCGVRVFDKFMKAVTEELQLPPLLIFQNTSEFYDCMDSIAFYRQMKECGKDAQLYLIDGVGYNKNKSVTDDVLRAVDRFLKENIAKSFRPAEDVHIENYSEEEYIPF